MTPINQTISKSGKAEFVIIRKFNASRELVFKAFSESERLAQWWEPKRFKITVVKLDFTSDGLFLYKMENQGQDMWGRFIYGEIEIPDYIEFVSSFSNEKGGITRAPFSQSWPLEVFNILTFSEQDGKTIITLKGYPINATDEEVNTFVEGSSSIKQGFAGTFDQLEEYLSKM